MGMSSSRSSGPVAEINVTPLVDVMLVLLIIFMVTAPMMQQGVDVDLPKTTNKSIKSTEDPLIVSIDKNSKIFLGSGNETPLEAVGIKAAAVLEARNEGEKKVFVKADKSIPYGRMMEVMGKLHESGITQIGLISGAPDVESK